MAPHSIILTFKFVFVYMCVKSTLFICAQRINDVTVDLNGQYQGLSVAISSHMKEADCQDIVTQIKKLLEETSQHMNTATGGKLSFGKNVDIIIPHTWNSCGDKTPEFTTKTLKNPPLIVDSTHPLFGDNLWTQQPRQCGMPGDYTYIPFNWLMKNEINGKEMLQEWAKLRWGVFDEHGYNGDAVYPPAYRNTLNLLSPNYCSDVPVVADVSNCNTGDTCNVEIDPAQNTQISSSLMAFSQLDNVNRFCDKDNHKSLPTKHNILCDGKSVQEIIDQHSDLDIQTPQPNTNGISYKILKSPRNDPLYVSIAIDCTNQMGTPTHISFTFVKESLQQFISFEIDEATSLSLVKFNNDATVIAGTSTVHSDRESFINAIEELKPDLTPEAKSLEYAIKTAAQTIPDGEIGNILLITGNYGVENGDVNILIRASNGHKINIILLTTENNPYPTTLYENITEQTGGQLNVVINDGLISRQNIFSALRADNIGSSFHKIWNGSCIENKTCNSLGFPIDILYSEEIYVYIYKELITDATYDISVKANREDCTDLNSTFESAIVYLCPAIQGERIFISITKGQAQHEIYYEISGLRKYFEVLNEVSFWWAQDYQQKDTTILYTSVIRENRYVLDAIVSAKISSPPEEYSPFEFSISLKDKGTGADVTGNDGIYSAYLIGLETNYDGQINVQINSQDNPGSSVYYPNDIVSGSSVDCCGSVIKLPADLEQVETFVMTHNENINNIAISSIDSYAPSQITDLVLSTSGNSISLEFTAPGAHLDQGTVSSYTIQYATTDGSVNEINNTNTDPKGFGEREVISISAPKCDEILTYSIKSGNNKTFSKSSNEVSIYTPCEIETNAASVGLIVGITFGVLLALLLIIYLLCLCQNKDNKEDSMVWHCTLCRCCRSSDKSHSTPTNKRSAINPQPIQRIKTVSDLYAVPDKKYNEIQNQGYDSDTDEGGFVKLSISDSPKIRSMVNNQKSNDNLSLNYPVEQQQQPSIHSSEFSTLPINTVGVPYSRGSFDYYPSYHASSRPVIPVDTIEKIRSQSDNNAIETFPYLAQHKYNTNV